MTTIKMVSSVSALVITMLVLTPAYAGYSEHNRNDGHNRSEHQNSDVWFDGAEKNHTNNDGHNASEHQKLEKHSLDVHTQNEHVSNNTQDATNNDTQKN